MGIRFDSLFAQILLDAPKIGVKYLEKSCPVDLSKKKKWYRDLDPPLGLTPLIVCCGAPSHFVYGTLQWLNVLIALVVNENESESRLILCKCTSEYMFYHFTLNLCRFRTKVADFWGF